MPSLARAAAAEFIATALLLVAVVGSGIAAERLCGGNVGLALLANAIATGGALFALIVTFGPVSGAHMNPAVTVAAGLLDGFPWSRAPLYIGAQIAGALAGVALAHAMFEVPLWQAGTHVRVGTGQWISEAVATSGLLLVIWGSAKHGIATVAAAVACYITGAYWFTASTSFANPAVTIARATTDTFAGIRPEDVPAFIAAQVCGAAIAIVFAGVLRRPVPANGNMH